MISVFFCGLMIAVLIFIAAKASLNLCLLTGTTAGRNGQLVYLISDEQAGPTEVLCSVTIQNNKFRLSCPVAHALPVYLIIGAGEDQAKYPMVISQGQFSFCETQYKHLVKTT